MAGRTLFTGLDLRLPRVSVPITARTALAMVGVAGAVLVLGLVLGTGGAVVWLTAAAVAAIAVRAAQLDMLTLQIPNALVLQAASVLAVAVPVIVLVDDRGLVDVLADVGAGWCLSGAPLLFLLWLGWPRLIGGGDWKWLGVLGATIGLVDPMAALMLVVVACFVQAGLGLMVGDGRSRDLPFGPALLLGFVVVLGVAIVSGYQLGAGV